jgi:hypothetical protein
VGKKKKAFLGWGSPPPPPPEIFAILPTKPVGFGQMPI